MGRPTKRTPQVIKKIHDAVENGASDTAAAQAAGIATSTFYEWLKDPTFSEGVAQARARAVIKAEALVFGGNPLAWLTKGPGRKFAPPEEAWSDASKIELTGRDGGAVRLAHLSDGAQDAARRFLRDAGSD